MYTDMYLWRLQLVDDRPLTLVAAHTFELSRSADHLVFLLLWRRRSEKHIHRVELAHPVFQMSRRTHSSEINYGPGESFDGNPFGKPGQDFRKRDREEDAAKERERLERMRLAAGIPDAPPDMDDYPEPELPETCTVCSIM